MRGFGSDNHSGVHPELLKSISECNTDHAPSYGTDSVSEKAIARFKEHFGPQTEVFFVFNGTASNVLSLRFLMDRHESVICSDTSHVHHDECGAPEFFAGKLLVTRSQHGKMSLEDIQAQVVRRGDQHFSQPRVITLTQPTELGTCYSLDEIRMITDWARQNSLYVHIDGARLPNALIHLGCTFKQMTTDLGVDVVSFGGTKNGMLAGEAILVLNPKLAEKAQQKLKFIRKQCAQLPSKTRFIACQFERFLRDDLYLQIARHSIVMAERLHSELKQIPNLEITAPRESNAVFVKIPKTIVKSLREKYFFYVWNEKTFECRLMTSWDTTAGDIDHFTRIARELSTTKPSL